MNTALADGVSVLGGLLRLTGPIFDKELRVASRRRRSYALRSAYIALLCLFILYVWLITVRLGGPGSASFQASRMGEAGRRVITAIIWFQFVAAQLMAIVLLSTSIGGEIRQRTLSVLMTTPINSLQIVMGKLLSGLLQVMLLLAISLPMLAIIRVFGGVPWGHVVSGLCITLTAAVFAGALSLLLSMTARHAYTVVLAIMTGYLLVFGASSGLIGMLSAWGLFGSTFAEVILYVLNPFGALHAVLSLGKTAGVISSWPVHCAIMLSATVGVVSLAVWRFRKIALSEAFGGAAKQAAGKEPKASVRKRPSRASSAIRRVEGAPIVWKEMRKPFFGRRKASFILYAVLAGVILVGSIPMVFGLRMGRGFGSPLFSYLMMGFSLIVFVRLAVLSAASITAEKEAGTWPILLATPLDDTEIVRGKAIAAFRRNVPLLLLLILLQVVPYLGIILFRGMGFLSVFYTIIYTIIYAIGLAGTVVFVIGLGLYFGVRLKSTNAAVASTVGIYIGVELFGRRVLTTLLYSIFLAASYRQGGRGAVLTWLIPIAVTLIPTCVCLGVGLLAAQRARCRLRRNIF